MAPRACRESLANVASTLVTLVHHHPKSPRKSRHHCAMLCLGEGSTRAELSCLDLHCSFEALRSVEYRGRDHLDFAAWNYVENVRRQQCTVTTWTSSSVIPPQRATGWYFCTIVWKWPPNWVVTTGPSGGSDLGRSYPIGSPHWRFWLGTPDSTMWMLTPCWGMLCTLPSGIRKRLLEPMTMSTTRAERWGNYN